MLFDSLKNLGRRVEEFDRIAVIGNDEDDADFAKNLNAQYIDVSGKTYEELKKEFDNT